MSKLSNTQRQEIYRRDGFQCAICSGTTGLQVHHYIPRGKGGANHPQNLIVLCHYCHAQVHGIIPGFGGFEVADDMEQAIAEYLGDYYAPDWYPYIG